MGCSLVLGVGVLWGAVVECGLVLALDAVVVLGVGVV